MKHIYRKPFLPILFSLMLCFSVCFITLFNKSIYDDTLLVDELYNNTKLEFQILPGDHSGSVLLLDTFVGGKIKNVEQITETCTLMWCSYSLRTPVLEAGIGTVYGTDNIWMLAQKLDIALDIAPEFSRDSFCYRAGEATSCVMEQSLAARLGLMPGERFTIAATEDTSCDPEKAPSLEMFLMGTFQCDGEYPDVNGLIVPEELFLAKPGLLYNSNMMYDCFYRDYYFSIDPAYNRNYEDIQRIVEEILDDPEDFTIYSNAKSLEQMVRPIERRLAVQRMLVIPLAILFALSCTVLAILMTLGLQTEVFLRFMWGQSRWKVWLSMMISVVVVYAAASMVAIGLVWLLAGLQWLHWAMMYMGSLVAMSILCSALALVRDCSKNLVRFYQSKEG